MKLLQALLLLSICFLSIYSLHLTQHKNSHKSKITKFSHQGISYYGKHYLSHRSQQYIQQVKNQNKKKIQDFNNKNKESLKKNGTLAKGGNSYVMGKTKFLQFTKDQFVHLFTGLKRNETSHEHHQIKNHDEVLTQSQEHKSKHLSVSQQMFDHFLANKILQNLDHSSQQIKSHNKKISHRQDDDEQNDQQDGDQQDWQFEDPFEIDENQINDLYGDVNNEDSWGWNWKQFDDDYYDEEEDQQDQDYDNYWKQWEDDHWGYDDQDQTSQDSDSKSPWWKNWEDQAQQNQGKDDWWYDDNWDDADWDESNNGNQQDQQNKQEQQEQQDQSNQQNQQDQHKTLVITGHPHFKQVKLSHNQKSSGFSAYPNNAVEVNWAKKGATTHVKNQGVCGSCWTYSAVGVIEAYFLIKGKGVTDLSEQQILDCQKTSCYGCDGGQQNMGLDFAVKSGLVAQSKYPYRGVQKKCAQKTGPHKIPKYTRVSGRSKIQQALRKGPITAAVYVDDGFQFYEKGIFDKCIKDEPNHAVVLVGFTKDYWIVRNSWGEDWGQKGHIRIKKNQNKNNACSIENDAYAISL